MREKWDLCALISLVASCLNRDAQSNHASPMEWGQNGSGVAGTSCLVPRGGTVEESPAIHRWESREEHPESRRDGIPGKTVTGNRLTHPDSSTSSPIYSLVGANNWFRVEAPRFSVVNESL
jgi:hypothetical protein